MDLITWLLKHPDAGYAAYTLVFATLLATALGKEWIVLGKASRKTDKALSDCQTLMTSVNEQLVEQRILNERSAGQITALNGQVLELQLEVADLRGALRQQRAHP